MSFLQVHKKKLLYFLLAIVFLFKFVALQEYVHAEQHKENKTHIECQFCTTIFNAAHHSFILEEVQEFVFNLLFFTYEKAERYVYVFIKAVYLSEFYNRPPPVCNI